jgi:hypothetical protein
MAMRHSMHTTRTRLRSLASGGLAAASLLLVATQGGHAALIEIPATGAGQQALSGSWQERAGLLPLALSANAVAGLRPGHAHAGAISLARAGGDRLGFKHPLPEVDSGLYAAIDAPFGAMGSASSLGPDSETEFWTVLLVGAGLIAYQIRRKSRAGFIRVRPL